MSKPVRPEPAVGQPTRGGLALVRLRLRLALLTMAIVPVAISVAFVFAVVGSQGLKERAKAGGDSAVLSGRVASELERTSSVLLLMAADPAVRDHIQAAHGRAAPAAPPHVRGSLAGLASIAPAGLTGVTVIDRDLRSVLRFDGRGVFVPDPPAPYDSPDVSALRSAMAMAAGSIDIGDPIAPTSRDRAVALLSPVVAASGARDSDAVGVVRFEVSLDRLLAVASPDLRDGDLAIVVDTATSTVLAQTGTPAERRTGAREALGGRVDEVARGSTDAIGELLQEGWAAGSARISVPGVADASWSVVVLESTPPPAFPIELVGALALVALIAVGLTVWMSRQILLPAEELETSRRHLKRLYESAREDSLRDGLTGLGNHRAFQEELDRQLEWYRRYHVPIALLLIDMDDLKLVNDTSGHAAGDEQLRRMGRAIGEVVRYADRAFRIGGDEFAILMPHTDVDGALQLGRRLQAKAAQVPSGVPGARPVAFSGGVSACPALATDRSRLYAQADAALYWCKRHGRSTLDAFDPMRDREADQPAIDGVTASIVRVASERLLRPVFQPIVDMSTGRVLGYEGLVRPTEGSGFENPGSLFAAANAIGRTVELDHACLDVVAAGASAISAEQVVSFNLSPRTVEAPHFSARSILDTFERHGIDAHRVIVELTEREDVLDVARLRRNLADLQAAGIRVAADDVGAGNAGLRLLSQFRFDIVKIDLSLVQEGAQRASSRAVLRSLRDLAGRWDAFVIAEGLETPEQLQVVRELGISAGQGYLLGRPAASLGPPAIDLAGLEQGRLIMQAAPGGPEVAAPRLGQV